MPMYTFICNECGVRKTATHSIKEIAPMIPVCLHCGDTMDRDYQTDMFSTPKDSYRTPIHSDALAIAPDQRKEHERLYPYIKLDKKNRPVFDKYGPHQKYLDETGFRKNPGKKKRRTVKVS